MNALVETPAALSLRGMQVLERGVYRGPHAYSDLPMIRIQIDLGDLEHLLSAGDRFDPTERRPAPAG